MAIKVTASGNFENKKSWSGMKKHMEHDEKINHSNEFLNTEKSKELKKYNQHKVLINYEEFVNSAFGSYVKEHDKNLKDKKRAYKSVDRFLKVDSTGKERELQPVQAYMEKFTDKETYEGILSVLEERLRHCHYRGHKELLTPAQAHDEALKAIATGLSNYADGFNERNPNLKMFEYHSHLDEEGAPHIHARVMPFSGLNKKTKTGKPKKPSWSLNAALRAQYGGTSNGNKDRLAKFREQEDTALITSMNKSFEYLLGKDALELYRKTKVEHVTTGLSHEEYTTKKKNELRQEIDAKKARIEEQNNKIAKNDVTLSNQKQAITANNRTIVNQQNDIAQQKEEIADNEDTKKNQKEEIDNNKVVITKQHKRLEKQARLLKEYFDKWNEMLDKCRKVTHKFTQEIAERVNSALNEPIYDVSIDELPMITNEIAKGTKTAVEHIKDNYQDAEKAQAKSDEWQQKAQKHVQQPKQKEDDGLDM